MNLQKKRGRMSTKDSERHEKGASKRGTKKAPPFMEGSAIIFHFTGKS